MKLSKIEQETIILFNEGEADAEVYDDSLKEERMVKREVRWSEKRKFALWATEGTLEKTKAWYKKDNCFSRSEFIEKAIDFYVGYLSSEENESYLPNIVISTLKGLIAESDNKQNRMLFKLAVEISMMMNLMAATQDIDKIALERLRGECVKEVARLNGAFSFEDALDWQKG